MHVYLDNAATTKVSAAAFRAMEPYFTEQYGNPSSLYAFGQKAHEAITEARERIAALLHCDIQGKSPLLPAAAKPIPRPFVQLPSGVPKEANGTLYRQRLSITPFCTPWKA